ncbi:MAG: transglutaminase family protein [Pseudomonadota bacterium]
MSIHVALRHRTTYRFDRAVNLSPHLVRLKPAAHCRTPIQAYSLKVEPAQHFIHWQQDPFGNFVARLTFPGKARELIIDVEVIADLAVINPFDFFIDAHAEHWPFAYTPEQAQQLLPYLELDAGGPQFDALVQSIDCSPVLTVNKLVEINRIVYDLVEYSIRMEAGVQTPEETLGRGLGSCRDSAWLLVQLARRLGLAARFVSGYLVQLAPDMEALDGPSGPTSDFTDLHAWAEIYVPGAGWIGLDPTSGLLAGEGHIPLACTPLPGGAAPIEGGTDVCEVEFDFLNEVTRIHESPRVTRPYSDLQWAAMAALGRQVEARMRAADMRLTQGGEPTFVAIENTDAPEWNVDALGPHKRERAEVLVRRLGARFAPGALLHTAQGKWYPGEPLPRWSLGLYWRKDGVPVWRNPALLAEPGVDLGHGPEDARRFGEALCAALDLDRRFLVTAYEDGLQALEDEARLPLEWRVDGADKRDVETRRALFAQLSAGLDNPRGYVLPLAFSAISQRWVSAPWTFRRGRLSLVPGDSPLGLRLPLDSLPWVDEGLRDETPPRDPFDTHEPLTDFHDAAVVGEVAARYAQLAPLVEAHPEVHAQAPDPVHVQVPHTALALEARGGVLHVFLPPFNTLEPVLALIARIEQTAEALGMPVVMEGYPPPSDPRMEKLLVTPDPGVIEVNIHPSASWEELSERTEALYEEARLARLSCEKFMLDGRHTGTGGGNHMTLGGRTPADSPFLRRPDLLRSLVTYWQHHPSLSYLFSGLFIGPTSQAPRVDEGREDRVYELEIALGEIDRLVDELGAGVMPWTVDRALRHLLTDLTGNTHRAEICIDKLYSPDSSTGRLGLVELRGFEMPPHPRMALAQALLVRAILLRLWESPYRKPPVRWGTLLHDRFMLGHYLAEDLRDVLADLREHGLPLEMEWFVPFLEFRLPEYGRRQFGETELILRAAIEPWHVLGEEATAQGTARFVDSSVERLEVKLLGLTDGRHVLACNGRRVPLRPTAIQGEYVAGVRYRAWQPPSALHPTIGVNAPLVFELIDTWNGKSIGGCTYHVMHPGGRNFQQFPVNASEAEARRITRFETKGHTHGAYTYTPLPWLPVGSRVQWQEGPPRPMMPPVEERAPEMPHTLDLRRPFGR